MSESKEVKATTAFESDMDYEANKYYFDQYSNHFDNDGFKEALASIPYSFVWDDHDIFDGFGILV